MGVRIRPPTGSVTTVCELADERGEQREQQRKPPKDERALWRAVEALREAAKGSAPELEFAVDEAHDAIAVFVQRGGKRELVRRIPEEEALDFAATLRERGAKLLDRWG